MNNKIKTYLSFLTPLLWFSLIFINLYLFGVKVLSYSCAGGGGCSNIIHSSYGTVLGIPVTLLSLVVVLALPLFSSFYQKIILSLMLAGGIYFVAVQVFVLQAFCSWCNAHHLLVALLLVLPALKIRYTTAVLSLGLPLTLFALYFNNEEVTPKPEPPQQNVHSALAIVHSNELEFFGPTNMSSNILVLSFDCPHCITLVDEIFSYQSIRANILAPKVYISTTPANFETSVIVLATYLKTGDFITTWFHLGGVTDFLMVNNSSRVARAVAHLDIEPYKERAREILTSHAEFLDKNNLFGSPLLVTTDDSFQSFTASDTFRNE